MRALLVFCALGALAVAPLSARAEDVGSRIDEARGLMRSGSYVEAARILGEVVRQDSTDAEACKLYGISLMMADQGYDAGIAEDTTLRANQAMDMARYLDRAVELAPDDMEARLYRGITGVSLPFFVGKLDQGIEDLRMITTGQAPDSLKAQAMYWLGFGLQRKGLSYWTQVATRYPDAPAGRMAFQGMRPSIERFDRSRHAGPVVVVDFVLGFRDELAPQTAVWVETEKGEFVKTLYISGFAGHAKDVQPVLFDYGDVSKYVDADAVTGASIDFGQHICVWDLKDAAGEKTPPGKYVIKVETDYWPSMKYQLVSASVEVGKGQSRSVVEEGNFIPYLEVEYLP